MLGEAPGNVFKCGKSLGMGSNGTWYRSGCTYRRVRLEYSYFLNLFNGTSVLRTPNEEL